MPHTQCVGHTQTRSGVTKSQPNVPVNAGARGSKERSAGQNTAVTSL